MEIRQNEEEEGGETRWGRDDGKEDEKEAFDDHGPTEIEHIAREQPPTVYEIREQFYFGGTKKQG